MQGGWRQQFREGLVRVLWGLFRSWFRRQDCCLRGAWSEFKIIWVCLGLAEGSGLAQGCSRWV